MFHHLFETLKSKRIILYTCRFKNLSTDSSVLVSYFRFFPSFFHTPCHSICHPFGLARQLIGRLRRPSYWFHKQNFDRRSLILPWNQLYELSPVGAGIFYTASNSRRHLSIPCAVICIQMRRSSLRDYTRRRGLLILKLLSGPESLYYFSHRSQFYIYCTSSDILGCSRKYF